MTANYINILHRPESSDWVSAVMGLEKPPNNEHAIWSEQAGIDWEKAKAKGTETETTAGTETGTDTEGEEEREEVSRASGSSGAEWSGASADEWK